MTDEWIEIVAWDKFQHYRQRDPNWIKNYNRLLVDPNYRRLTAAQRGVLHGLWLLYAASHWKVPGNTAELSRALGVRVTSVQLAALNHAGFIEFCASAPAHARTRSREEELRSSKERAGAKHVASDAPARREEEKQEEPRDPEAAAKARALMREVFGSLEAP